MQGRAQQFPFLLVTSRVFFPGWGGRRGMPSPDIPSERVSSAERREESPSPPPQATPLIHSRTVTCLVVTRKLPLSQAEGPPV